MDWITNNIAIGNFVDARALTVSDVEAVLCLKEACCDESDDEFCTMCVPLIDGPGNDKNAVEDAIAFIDDIVRRDERVLVHCHAGRSRSVCIVARYLMAIRGWSREKSLQFISSKREIYLSPGIEEILRIRG